MTITKKQDGNRMEVFLEGRLDTVTSPELEQEMEHLPEEVTELTLDFEKLDYISSAGLRVLLQLQKTMGKKGSMAVRNINSVIEEVFRLTGFNNILHILP